MMVSEVTQLRQRIAQEYQAARWGLAGLAYGTSQHQFITTCAENIGQSFAQLVQVVGSPATAMAMLNETLQSVAETPTRLDLLTLLRRSLGKTEESTRLIDHIEEMWNTIDRLKERFGLEQARKIIEIPSPCISATEEHCQ
jgi:hypothetical protein